MSQITRYPAVGANSPVDGYAYHILGAGSGVSFANLMAAAGNGAGVSDAQGGLELLADTGADNWRYNNRQILCFDTSAIGAGQTISSAILSVRGYLVQNPSGGNMDVCIVAATPAATNNLANGDYAQLGSTKFATVTEANLSSTGYVDFTLNAAGIANISTSGVTKFGVKFVWDADGAFDGTWHSGDDNRFGYYFSDQGDGYKPTLVVNYAPSSAIKTINGLAKASVKTVNGLAIASVKTWNGLT